MSADRVTILKHDCWVSSVYSCYTSLAFSKISAKRLNIFKILHWLSQFTIIFILKVLHNLAIGYPLDISALSIQLTLTFTRTNQRSTSCGDLLHHANN